MKALAGRAAAAVRRAGGRVAGTPRWRSQRGSVSVFVVVMVPALLVAAGLVLDGGRQIDARRDARGAAQAAARAAVQPSDDEALAGQLDPGLAVARASAELAVSGASGVAAVVGDEVVVTVTRSVEYVILPGGATVRESASARAVRGVEGGIP